MGYKKTLPSGLRALILVLGVIVLQWLSPMAGSSCVEIDGELPQTILEPESRWQGAVLAEIVSTWDSLTTQSWTRLQGLAHRYTPPERSYRIVAVETTRTSTSNRLYWPVTGDITSGYGLRRHPVTHRRSFHAGIDIRSHAGVSVKSPLGGKVTFSRRAGANGNLIKIDCGNDLILSFAHLSRIQCAREQTVKRGQVIGLVGASGRATGPHLHFSMQKNGRYVNPLTYLE